MKAWLSVKDHPVAVLQRAMYHVAKEQLYACFFDVAQVDSVAIRVFNRFDCIRVREQAIVPVCRVRIRDSHWLGKLLSD